MLDLDIRYKLFLCLKCLYIVIRWRKAYNMRYAISYIEYPGWIKAVGKRICLRVYA